METCKRRVAVYPSQYTKKQSNTNRTIVVRLCSAIEHNRTSSFVWVRLTNKSNAIELNLVWFCSECRMASSVGWTPVCWAVGRGFNWTPAGPPTRVFKITGEIMLAVIKDHVSVQMIASLDGDVKPLALSPSYFLFNWKGTWKNPHCSSKTVGDVDPGGVDYLSWREGTVTGPQ